MSNHNKEIVRRVYAEVLNEGRFDLVPELYCPDCISVDPANKRELAGLAEITELMRLYRKHLPGHHYEIKDMVAEGDTVVVRWTVHVPMPQSGEEIEIDGIKMCRFKDGKIHRIWQHYDSRRLLEALAGVGGWQSIASSVPEAVERTFGAH